jgi:signal transduction histidine kinase/PAS domain-containing protein
MSFFKPRNLQTKFILGLAVIMAVIGVFFVFLLQQYLRETLEQEARGKAQVILRGVESLHAYVQDNLRPVITGSLLEDERLLEAMSCTALARASMGPSWQEGNEDFRFRRVAIDARSPDLEARGLERSFIERFNADPARQWDEAFIREGGQEYLVMAQPVRYQEFCLRCHGDPLTAPRDLIETYGADRGFNRKEGELAGAHVVRLPMQATAMRIHGATLGFVLMFSLGTLFLFGTIYVFFNRLVVHNLRRAQAAMSRHFPEAANLQNPHPLATSPDEIEQMLTSLEQFAGSLREARSQLQSYAANLETMVERRTGDLSREADARRADVSLFVNLLGGLSRNRERKDVLDACLELIAKRFGALRVTYCCAMSMGATYSWPDQWAATPLPAAWERMAAGNEPQFLGACAYVPVQASGAPQGLLTLCWPGDADPAVMPTEVLMAVGRQLGVVMENLDALDNLMRQNDLLHAVFEGISDPVALLDANGRVALANQSAKALGAQDIEGGAPGVSVADRGGLAAHTAQPRPARSGPGGPDGAQGQAAPSTLEALLRAAGVEAGKPLPEETLAGPPVREVNLPGGRAFLVSLYPLPEYGSRGRRLVAYVREVTDERRMRETAQQNEKLLAVGRLAAGLAHEINNPLGVILFYGELLKASAGLGESREDVEVILRHTRQAQKVLRDLLDFVRPKKGAIGPCDLALAARRTAGVFQAQAAAEGVALTVDAPEGMPEVLADPTALEQILSNLLINALDAVGPRGGGRIAVSAGLSGGQAWLRVADNGPGIDPENLSRIFDPFFTTKEVGKGTGLGLAVVFGLVTDMGGTVAAENDGGAAFTIRLPLARNAEGSREAA